MKKAPNKLNLVMSNAAVNALDPIAVRSRSQFVSDAIVFYANQKGVMDNYMLRFDAPVIENSVVLKSNKVTKATVAKQTKQQPKQTIEKPVDHKPAVLNTGGKTLEDLSNVEIVPKNKIDSGFN